MTDGLVVFADTVESVDGGLMAVIDLVVSEFLKGLCWFVSVTI